MIKTTVSKNHKGEYYASVQFALMDGGHGEYKHTNQTTGVTTWEVIDTLADGGMLVRVMNEKEYAQYKNA